MPIRLTTFDIDKFFNTKKVATTYITPSLTFKLLINILFNEIFTILFQNVLFENANQKLVVSVSYLVVYFLVPHFGTLQLNALYYKVQIHLLNQLETLKNWFGKLIFCPFRIFMFNILNEQAKSINDTIFDIQINYSPKANLSVNQ